jgi:hypothetical protein
MEKDDTIYLRHILDAINTIEEYLQGVNEDTFKTTQLLQGRNDFHVLSRRVELVETSWLPWHRPRTLHERAVRGRWQV